MLEPVSIMWLLMEEIDSKGTLASSQEYLRFQLVVLCESTAGSP